MTEAEWLACDDPAEVLRRARYRPDGRKIRLLVCAWCRRRWGALDPRHRDAVEVAERFADGRADGGELGRAREAAQGVRVLYGVAAAYAGAIEHGHARTAALHLAHHPPDGGPAAASDRAAERAAQAALVREVFGNPFRPVALDPGWRADAAVAVAAGMYESRDFGGMPLLAAALQDAGCNNPEMLEHCRDASLPHVRGCWVVDLILGRG